VPRTIYRVFVDESGVRAHGPKTSKHFVLSACIFPDQNQPDVLSTVADIRVNLRQPPAHTISFKDLTHQSRVYVVSRYAALPYLTVTSVIVCKREVPKPMTDLDGAYLYTLRFLLERISWFVDDAKGQAYVTFAHIDYFKIDKLHEYVETLRHQHTEIRWQALFLPVRMQTMQGNDFLQVADTVASATAQAFEPDRFGNVEQRYLRDLGPRIYRRGRKVTSYGLKLHPRKMAQDAAYSWVEAI
jgi:hypothetical protein